MILVLVKPNNYNPDYYCILEYNTNLHEQISTSYQDYSI